jgi:hypothetical protein
MLKADCKNPALLTLVGQPVQVPGEFPNTVAASLKNHLVCVGTTGRKAGISCASFGEHGLAVMDSLRPFDLNQTTPPTGPPNTVAQTFFSADESHLFTTVKGTPGTDAGFFSVFPVQGGFRPDTAATVARQDVRSSFNGTALLFGSAVIPSSSHIFVTDPTFGVAVLNVNAKTNEATLLSRKPIAGQMALCWAAYSSERKSIFVIDAQMNRFIELNATDASVVSSVDLPNQDPGYIDVQAAGDIVYALSPGNGTTEASIVVYDSMKKKQVQHVSLKSKGADKNAVGMAYLQL